MKVVLERIEITWWQFHIRLLDESELLRALLPHFRVLYNQRQEISRAITWAAIGLPVGLILGALKSLIP